MNFSGAKINQTRGRIRAPDDENEEEPLPYIYTRRDPKNKNKHF